MFNDKSILITGGTGSFGNKYTQLLLENFKPKKIIIFSRDEYKQYLMQQKFNDSCMRYFIGDVRDFNRLNQAMRGVDFVIHAAAMKHVPASEYNPMECVRTNINGSENVIRASIENNVKKVIALSTDKAANPINLYGATKLAADKLFVAGNNIAGGHETIFSIVRYGNVVGSRGSVVPLFKRLIEEKSEYLPITHSEMTRFWITLKQGVDFVLKNFQRMQGGEIFVPKIPSVKIVDLADSLDSSIPKKIIGIRPGEKLHEVMCAADDSHLTYDFGDHYVIAPSIQFNNNVSNYSKNLIGESGSLVERNFEYSSGSNEKFLSVEEIKLFDKHAEE